MNMWTIRKSMSRTRSERHMVLTTLTSLPSRLSSIASSVWELCCYNFGGSWLEQEAAFPLLVSWKEGADSSKVQRDPLVVRVWGFLNKNKYVPFSMLMVCLSHSFPFLFSSWALSLPRCPLFFSWRGISIIWTIHSPMCSTVVSILGDGTRYTKLVHTGISLLKAARPIFNYSLLLFPCSCSIPQSPRPSFPAASQLFSSSACNLLFSLQALPAKESFPGSTPQFYRRCHEAVSSSQWRVCSWEWPSSPCFWYEMVGKGQGEQHGLTLHAWDGGSKESVAKVGHPAV